MARAMPVAITYERASLKASLNRQEISGRGAASAGRAAEGVADGLPDSIKTAFFRMIGRACSLDAAFFHGVTIICICRLQESRQGFLMVAANAGCQPAMTFSTQRSLSLHD